MDLPMFQPTVFLGNARGEPTTEWVAGKQEADVQPFTSPSGLWKFSHNGTIANDKALRTGALPTSIDSAAIVEQLAQASAQGATTGILMAATRFSADRTGLGAPDRLGVEYVVTASDAG